MKTTERSYTFRDNLNDQHDGPAKTFSRRSHTFPDFHMSDIPKFPLFTPPPEKKKNSFPELITCEVLPPAPPLILVSLKLQTHRRSQLWSRHCPQIGI